MSFSHNDKKEVFDFFFKLLEIFDDFVYYENIRGHISKAPKSVRNYVLKKCKGEDLLEYFKRRKNYFIVENNRVALKGKKKIPSHQDDVNTHSAALNKEDPKEQKSETVIQFNQECAPESTTPSIEDEEREKYENYSIQYFRGYLNRNKKVRIEWIIFNDLPKKVKRFLHNYYNKKVRAFFISFPTEFSIDEADCVSLRTVSLTRSDVKQTVKPELVVKLGKSRCGASNAEVQRSMCRFECIKFFVKILHQKQTPYAIDKLGGYLSQAPTHVKDHIKFTHRTFNNFFKDSPKIFQTDVPGKVTLTPSYDKVLRSLKKLLKEALSNPPDNSLKKAVDSLLQSESFNCRRPEDKEGTYKMFKESTLLYINSTDRIIPEDNFNESDKHQKKVDLNKFNIPPKNTDDNINNDSFQSLDKSNIISENNDHEVQKESSYKCDIKVSIANNEMNNGFSDCLIQNCSVSEGNEEPVPLLLSENSTKKLIPELKKITVWKDNLYSKTTQSKNESLKENYANLTLKHKTDTYIENETYKNEVNASNKLEDVIKNEDSKERIDKYPEEYLLRESRVNFEISEKYNESQITKKMNLTMNCKESEQNLKWTKNAISDDIILKLPKEIGDARSDSANNQVSQEVKILDCDFSEFPSSNSFAHSVAHISIKEIDKLLQNDEFNIAKLDNQKKSDFTYEDNSIQLSPKSNETKFDYKCKEDESTYSDLLSHKSNEISSSYPDDNLGTSDRTNNLTEPSEEIKFLQNNDKPVENKNKIENTVTSDFDSLKDTKFEIGGSDSANNDSFYVHNQPGVQEKKLEKNVHSCEFTDSNYFIESVTDNVNNQPLQNDELKITIHENTENKKMFDSGYEEDAFLCLNVLFDTSNENSYSDDRSETSENDSTELFDETDNTHPAVQEKILPIHKFSKITGSNDIVDSINQINRIDRLLHYDKQTETENVENSIVDSVREDFTCLSHKSNGSLSLLYDDDHRTFNISYHQENNSNHSTLVSTNCRKFKKEFFKNMEMDLISGEKGVNEYDSTTDIRMFVKERSLNLIENENKAVTKQSQLKDDNDSFLLAEEIPVVKNALELSFNGNHFQNEELKISDDSTTLLGIDKKNSISEIHVIPELSRKQNEFSDEKVSLNDVAVAKSSVPKTCPSKCISTDSILKTDFSKTENRDNAPMHSSVDYPLQPISAEVTLLTSHSCLAQTHIESRLQIIYFIQSVFFCEKHESCLDCFKCLAVGDKVSCYISLSEIPHKIWIAFMVSKEGEHVCYTNEDSPKTMSFDLINNQDKSFNLSKECIGMDYHNSRSSTSMPEKDDICNLLETASVQSETLCLNASNLQLSAMQQFKAFKELNDCPSRGIVLKKVTNTRESSCQTEAVENRCRQSNSITCQTNDISLTKAEIMCQTDFSSDMKTIKNTTSTYSQTVSTGEIMIMEYYQL